MNLEDALAALQVGQVEFDLAVETSWAQKRRVERVGAAKEEVALVSCAEPRPVGTSPIGRHQHLDVTSCIEAVQLVDELEHRSLHLVVSAGAVVKASTTLCVTSSTSDSAPLRVHTSPRLTIASTSSIKMMHAFLLLAISNNSLTSLAPSPTYFCTNSEPITRINVASVRFATARAHSVLPVPGGPYKSTPLGGSMPS